MGEGRLANIPAPVALPKTQTALGQGEGILGGHTGREALWAPVIAHDVAGMGEGWLGHGRPQPTLKAYPSEGQGEGWVGHGRP
jgi:hypothetical protein